MTRRRCLPLLLLLTLPLGACDSLGGRNDDSKNLMAVDYTIIALYDGHQRTALISPAGEIAILEQLRDAPPRRVVAALTPAERTELIEAFRGWKKLNQYYATDISPQISISYDNWKVTTSSLEKAPKEFQDAKIKLDRIVLDISRAADAQTATAPATATSPATATAPATQK